MTRAFRLHLVAALLLAGAAAAQPASRRDANAPIDINSDRIEVQDRADRAVFVGRVHAVQGDMTMDAARMTVAYARARTPGADPEVQRVDASGGVTVVRPDQRASGSYGIYDLDRRLITLIGGVRLVRAGNTVNGARAVMNLDTGRATVDGSAVGDGAAAAKGGRVTGHFTVPKRADAPAAGAAPATPPK